MQISIHLGRIFLASALCTTIHAQRLPPAVEHAAAEKSAQTVASRKWAEAQAVSDLRQGAYGPVTPAQLEQAEAGQLIPILKDLFHLAQKESQRARTANDLFQLSVVPDQAARVATMLVRLGVQDTLYWDFLVNLAAPALESGEPGRRLDPDDIDTRARFGDVRYIVESGDPRAIPFLRQAFKSADPSVRAVAADGLATLHDNASIPAVIALLHRVSPSEQRSIAQTLLSFDEPSATAAANAVLPPRPDPLDELRRGEVTMGNLEEVANSHRVEALPLLRAEFPRIEDDSLKDKLAYALIRLRDPDPAAWDYLYERARAVIESGAPPPFKLGANATPTAVSPEFTAWAKAHNVSALPEDILYKMAGPVLELASTDDPRDIPLLREGLHSNHPVIPTISLNGLERVHAPGIIQYVVDECLRNPSSASTLAVQLVATDDDPGAAKAAARFLSPELLAELLKERVARTRPSQ